MDWLGHLSNQAPVAVCRVPTREHARPMPQVSQAPLGLVSPTSQAYITDIYNNVPLPPSAADVAAGLDAHTLSTMFATSSTTRRSLRASTMR